MAVTTQLSTELTNQAATPPVLSDINKIGGTLKIAYFTHTQDGVGDIGSSIKIAHLPAGNITLLGNLCQLTHNWVTASQTMDVGWDAHTNIDGTAVVADDNGLDDNVDVDTAGTITLGSDTSGTGVVHVFDSKEGVDIRVTAPTVALADGDTIEGFLVYVQG